MKYLKSQVPSIIKWSWTNTAAIYQLSYIERSIYFEHKKPGQPSSKGQLFVRNRWVQDPSQSSKEYKNFTIVGNSLSTSSAHQDLTCSLSYINWMWSTKHLLMHRIDNRANLLLCQYSTVQLDPIKIPTSACKNDILEKMNQLQLHFSIPFFYLK